MEDSLVYLATLLVVSILATYAISTFKKKPQPKQPKQVPNPCTKCDFKGNEKVCTQCKEVN